jgi:UDP-glucuronate 4-epimerase
VGSNQVCFVTGGAGFIGSHLCEALLKEGREVVTLDNFDPFYDPAIKHRNLQAIETTMQNEEIESSKFRWVDGDIRDKELLESIFTGLKEAGKQITIIRIAAKAGVRPSIDNAPLYTEVNIIGTQNIFEVAKSFGVQKLIYASSSSVYGENKKVPFGEEDPVDHPISPYAMTKKANELLAHTYHHLYSIDMVGLRFFTVYGPRQRPDLAISKFTRMIDHGEAIPFYGDGSTRRDYTYIDDIIEGMLAALRYIEQESDIYEIINLGESQTTTLRELVAYIESAVGKKAIIDTLPMQPGDVPQTYADISKARRLIGYNPKTLIEAGIAKYVEWYRAQEYRY